jgi:hypothetical protein
MLSAPSLVYNLANLVRLPPDYIIHLGGHCFHYNFQEINRNSIMPTDCQTVSPKPIDHW